MAGASPSVLQGKIDVALSQFARQYRNNNLVADFLFPRVEVLKQQDYYWTFGRENQKLAENALRGPGSAAERIAQTISKVLYKAQDHSLARLIPDEERSNFMAGDVEQWATGALMDKLLLDRENRIAALATVTATYAAGNFVTLAGGNQWSDVANSNPIGDVETGKSAIRKTGSEANVLIISDPVYQKLRVHPMIIDRFKYVKSGNVGLTELASVFEVEKVLLAAAVNLDNADVAQYVWGKHAVLAYASPTASFADPSFGKTMVWTEAPGTVAGFGTEIARETPASKKSDEVAVHFYYDIPVTSNISGYLFQNAVA